jgi:outer membrane protein OmpA-like peptidoglycan-associated protein
MTMKGLRSVAGLSAAALLFAGCAGMTHRERGTVIGATTGATVGGVIGSQTGSTARGAILGAVIGGAAGAIIGHQMDQAAKTIEETVPGVVVERIGEGIAVRFESGLMFDFDSDRLRPQAQADLRRFAQTLNDQPNTDILIVGHTDNVGNAQYNQQLSERRARAVGDYLASVGVSRMRLFMTGRGLAEPIAPNTTAEGRQENRRVEVAIYANEALREQARRQVGN